MKPRVKICCISNVQEAQLAISAGADALGLVGKMPSGPGVISDNRIKEIAVFVPPPVATFLLTSSTDAASIMQHYQLTQTNTIQIVDALPVAAYQQLREGLPGVKLVQVVHVQGEKSVEEAQRVAEIRCHPVGLWQSWLTCEGIGGHRTYTRLDHQPENL